MSFQIYSKSSFLCILCFKFLILVKIQLSLTCTIQPFSCGNVTADYPFSAKDELQICAPDQLRLRCDHGTATMMIKDTEYQVLDFYEEKQLLKIARKDYLEHGICAPPPFFNTTLDCELFDCSSTRNLTLRYCKDPPFGNPKCFPDDYDYTDGWIYKKDMSRPPCEDNTSVNVLVPAEKQIRSAFELEESLKQGIEVKWMLSGGFNCSQCRESKGLCGYGDEFKPVCYCPNKSISVTDCSTSTPGAHLCFKGC